MTTLKIWMTAAVTTLLLACGGGGGSAGSTPSSSSSTVGTESSSSSSAPAASANASVASLIITGASTAIKADGTSTISLNVKALTSSNALVEGATITLGATNNVVVSSPTVTTGTSGASFTISALASDQSNRISVVSANCSGCSASSANLQISVTGGSIGLTTTGGTNLIVGGLTSTLSATVKDASGNAMQNQSVTFASTDGSIIGVGNTLATTNASGVASITVSGVAPGNANVTATVLGNAASQNFTAVAASTALSFVSPANNAAVVSGVGQVVTASSPAASSITFNTTQGLFGNGQSSQTVATAGGSASATLTTSQGGTVIVTANDNLLQTSSLTLKVSPPVSAVNKVLFNASATTLPLSTGSNQASITLTATAIFNNGTTDQAVANVPIQFSMSGGPNAGEFLAPALAYTNSAGVATATFFSGSAASISNGIVVNAKVQGTAVQTGVAPSGNNLNLTVGGQALSVAFGAATELGQSGDKTLYTQAFGVQVTDANNNPVANQLVTLKLQPVAFSTGASCVIADTYCSEDANGNGSKDAGEDGVRKSTTEATAGSCAVAAAGAPGTIDGLLTPPNSDGGSVPSSVTTNSAGTAAFNLTYLKGSAFWIVNKLTATVSSNGTETSKSTVFRLAAIKDDVTPTCLLPNSPYSF